MKPFEIWTCHPPGWPEPHPCVIVSHSDRADRKNPVEVVMCSTQRAGRAAEAHEMILDTADGLNWQTLCKCDVIYSVPRAALNNKRGQVSLPRRKQLVQKIVSAHGWSEILTN